MANKKEKVEVESVDVIERLERASTDEAAMAPAPVKEEKKAKAATPAQEARDARRQVRRQLTESREAREQRIADEQAELTAESSIRSAIKAGTPFYGKASAVEIMKNSDGKEEVALVVLLQRTFKVVIPFNELFTYNPIDMSTVDLTTDQGISDYVYRKRAFAEKMIDAEIAFCILDVFPDGPVTTALGSRAAAMHKIASINFNGRNPRCKEGDIGEATVTAVSRHAIAVEFNGVDVVIRQYKLTLRWMRYVQEFYSIGDKIRVKVRQIKRDGDGNVIALDLDPIACELADSKERYALLKDGARVRGIVTNVYRPVGSRSIYIYAWIPSWEIPAKILRINANDFGREIKAGTQMRLEVSSHDENGYVTCIALSEHGNSGMFTRGRGR